MRRARLVLAFAVLSLSQGQAWSGGRPATEASARPGYLARLPDGRRLNFRCSGTGSPTVVFEGGYAATSLAWDGIRRRLPPTLRACAYDRSGYGFSDPGPMPRDGRAVALDLDQGLRAAGVKGPLILVGHSAGGLYVRLLGDRRPREIVGMVLVDPSVEFQDQRLAAVFGPGAGSLARQRDHAEQCRLAAVAGHLPAADGPLAACVPAAAPDQPSAVNTARRAEALRPSTWQAQVSELDTLWAQTSREIAAGRQSYGALPLIVLTADGTYAGVAERARPVIDDLWSRLHQEVAARSTHGRQQRVAHSSHMMMFDRPDAIVDAIAEIVRAWRMQPGRGQNAAG